MLPRLHYMPPHTDTLFPPSLQVGDSWFMSQRLRLPDGCEYEMQVGSGGVGYGGPASSIIIDKSG